MKIADVFSFKRGAEEIEEKKPGIWSEIATIISSVDAEKCRTKETKEKSKKKSAPDGRLYSPIAMNHEFKQYFGESWLPVRIPCSYRRIQSEAFHFQEEANNLITQLGEWKTKRSHLQAVEKFLLSVKSDTISVVGKNKAWENLNKAGLVNHENRLFRLTQPTKFTDVLECLTPDFIGFREMDFVKDRVGVEVQFGKYAFMVYNVCAKMTIFAKAGYIDFGVEIVPTKQLQRNMSTGVSFFEQFVWDLETRGPSDIDIPTAIIGIIP